MRAALWYGLATAILTLVGAPARAAVPTVASIELRSDVAVEEADELLTWVTVEVGRPLDSKEVTRSVRNLHAAGIASQIEAYVSRRDDGLAVVFAMRGKTLVEAVEYRGALALERQRLEEVVELGAGQPLVADRVFRSFYALRELYEGEGFLEVSVRVAVEEEEARRRARVRFDIEPGPPALVSAVSFAGDLGGLEETCLREALRLREGVRYRRAGEREDRERLETWLFRRGYRMATVAPVESQRSGDTEVSLQWTLEVGPRFEVEVRQPDLGKRLRKRGLLPLSGFERYDESSAGESEKRIRADFQSRGHYDCRVRVTEEAGADAIRLIVDVEPGPKFTLTGVRFSGNVALSSQRLQGIMRLAPRSLLSAESGVLVTDWLEGDLSSLRALYALEGYSKAEVGPPRVRRNLQTLELEIPIIEGPRRTVLDVSLEGVEQFEVAEVKAALPLREGGPYHPRRLDEAADLIRARYEARGYNQAQVSAGVEWSPDGSLASVSFEVLEGPQNLVERVIVRGRQKTKPVVLRRVIDLDRGAPVNQRRLLDLQRRLYGLGVFSNVNVQLVPGTPFSGGRDVLVDVREGKRQRLTYGLGYDSEDGARGLVGYSHGNLWGRAVTGRVDVRASQREEQARALLRQPYIGRFRWPVTYSVFKTERVEESFRSERRGAQVEVLRSRGSSRFGLLGTYKIVEISDTDPGLEVLEIDRSLQEVTVASVTPSLFLDHRDDAVDPQKGWSATLLTEYAFPLLNADEQFGRVFLQHARYLSLGRAGVVAVNGRLGAIEPLGSAGSPDPICLERGLDFPACRVKISERLFAGGRTTHRAYRRDRLGIAGETLIELDEGRLAPIGGTGLMLVNLDYRFPLGAGLGGTVFVDGGNVWPDWREVTPSGLKWGAGLGLRYASPVGPVRLEVGWKLDRLPSEDSYVVLFSFGNPF